jgi:hypothetical protein
MVSPFEFPALRVLRLLLVGFLPTLCEEILCSEIQVAYGQDFDLVSESQEVLESGDTTPTVAPSIVEKSKG